MSNFKFAHLLGLKKKASEEEEDDKEKGKKTKSRRAEEDRDDEEDSEDDDDREDMEDDDDRDPDDDDDKTSKNSKKARSRHAEDDEEDAEEDENDNRDVKKGRHAERKRCAAIFGSKHAAGRPDMAAHLAFSTRMSSREAINTLATIGAVPAVSSKRLSLDDRMHGEQVRLGPDGRKPSSSDKAALADKMTNLYNTVRGEK
ncbi:hypothetical protein [Candidatus Williamhamiltonella defendens]|uniref:Uncharacterized protein n=1 Tax=Candidatus Williamhamiltonella defendens TaxID=138072 RepID=A0A2D3TBH7_9ENTR|nr:hypothetical protein [Candidatus Hamiltonella defensa]ATW33135.1 hypothetical protein BJP43_01285 [Candidatus Hamiltonella defensa]